MEKYGYKGSRAVFNGLSYMIQEYIKIPKNTSTFQYNTRGEFNKLFVEFLLSINVKHSSSIDTNASIISSKHYSEFKEFIKLKTNRS